MAILGNNKSAEKHYRKNILPPLNDKGWNVNSSLKNLTIDGYNVSFISTTPWTGLSYVIPQSYAGKTLSFSVQRVDGVAPRLELNYKVNGVQQYNAVDMTTGARGKENVIIPYNATDITFYINVNNVTNAGYHYFEGVQVEVSPVSTSFQERYDGNTVAKKGLRMTGGTQRINTGLTNFLNVEKDFSIQVDFTPFLSDTIAGRTEDVLMGWYGNHEGLLYDETNKVIRGQIHFKNKTDGTSARESITAPYPIRKSGVATFTYNSANREMRLYVDGRLATSLVSSRTKDAYDFTPYTGELMMGYPSNAYNFAGIVRRATLYSKCLSEDEIKNGIKDPFSTVIDFDFTNQDITSNKVKDNTGKYTGTISGGVQKYVQKQSRRKQKNLLPPFAQWSKAISSVTVVYNTDYDVSFKSPSDWQGLYYNFPVKANTKYTFTYEEVTVKNNARWYIRWYDASGVMIGAGATPLYSSNPTVVTSPSNAKTARITAEPYSIANQFIRYRKPQFEEGDTATPFSPSSVLMNRRVRTTVRKAVKRFPFKFSRPTVAILNDGSKLTINQPREILDGIVVEEKTTNVLADKSLGTDKSNLQNWADYKTGTATQTITPIDTPYGKGVRLKAVGGGTTDRTGKGSIGTGATINLNSANATFSIWVKPLANTGSLRPYWDTENSASGKEYGTFSNISLANLTIGEWHRVQVTDTATSGTVFSNPTKYGSLFIWLEGAGEIEIACPQLEAKPYATSFTNVPRENESLYIPNINSYIDMTSGSLELEFEPLTGSGKDSTGNYGHHDLVMYDTVSGVIMRRLSNKYEFYTRKGSGLYNVQSTTGWTNESSVKYRMEWNASKDEVKFYVNDTYIGTAKMFSLSSNMPLYIGSRDDAQSGKGNAIYKSLIIRNRNGETVFRL